MGECEFSIFGFNCEFFALLYVCNFGHLAETKQLTPLRLTKDISLRKIAVMSIRRKRFTISAKNCSSRGGDNPLPCFFKFNSPFIVASKKPFKKINSFLLFPKSHFSVFCT